MSDTEKKRVPPSDGRKVKAMTYTSLEYDREPEEITGKLTTQPSPFGGLQCWIDGVQVNPESIRTIEEEGD